MRRVVTEDDLTVLVNKVRGGASVVKHGTVAASRVSRQTPQQGRASGTGQSIKLARVTAPSPLSLTLTGQLPSGKNAVRVRRDGHHYADKRFTNWRAEAYLQILQQHPTRTLITMPVRLSCHYWPGDACTRDVSGQLDALFHLFVYAKVLKDDGLIYDVKWRRHPVNATFPRVMLSLHGWETEEVTT